MISAKSRTSEWIMGTREDSRGKDPILKEKDDHVLDSGRGAPVEWAGFHLQGRNILLLLLGRPQRFSIDIDILVPKKISLDDYFQAMMSKGASIVMKKSARRRIPKQHYKFFFNSVIEDKESHIMLDTCWKRILILDFKKLSWIAAPFHRGEGHKGNLSDRGRIAGRQADSLCASYHRGFCMALAKNWRLPNNC